MLSYGAKVLGCVAYVDGEGEKEYAVRVAVGNSVHSVLPKLFAELSLYACYRKRDANLVSSLKLRALEWARKRGTPQYIASETIPSTIAVSLLQTSVEVAGMELLRSRAMMEAVHGDEGGPLTASNPYDEPVWQSHLDRDWFIQTSA